MRTPRDLAIASATDYEVHRTVHFYAGLAARSSEKSPGSEFARKMNEHYEAWRNEWNKRQFIMVANGV